jgi:hypothetical protein
VRKLVFLLIIVYVAVMFPGCTLQKKPNLGGNNSSKSSVATNPDLQQGQAVETLITKEVPEVDQAIAVILDHKIYVGLKVSGFDRLKLRKIREKTLKELEEAFPKDTIHVTTDKKVYWRIEQLKASIFKDSSLPKKEIEDKLEKIEKDMKG